MVGKTFLEISVIDDVLLCKAGLNNWHTLHTDVLLLLIGTQMILEGVRPVFTMTRVSWDIIKAQGIL